MSKFKELLDPYGDNYKVRTGMVMKIVEKLKEDFPEIESSYPMDNVYSFNEWFRKWFGDK